MIEKVVRISGISNSGIVKTRLFEATIERLLYQLNAAYPQDYNYFEIEVLEKTNSVENLGSIKFTT